MTVANDQPQPLLNTEQAAAYIGSTKRMFEEMRRQGRGPKFIRLSRRAVRYRFSDLVDWVESNLKSSTSES